MIAHLEILLLAMIGGLTYSLVWYAGKYIDPTKKTEKFAVYKFLASISFGALIGLIFIYGQIPVSNIWEGFQFLIYTALTAFTQKTSQTVYRKIKS